ncbi:hypothetical protein Vafri_12160 [Volvox africanus]|uniref:Uncharacterized protein n=1 Tax=Volvox africanus TaxID=51714 RepID=A0A8J4F541_9CHLO|nr:hypothetical protein Vafri_12160 [Volvox africanus]
MAAGTVRTRTSSLSSALSSCLQRRSNNNRGGEPSQPEVDIETAGSGGSSNHPAGRCTQQLKSLGLLADKACGYAAKGVAFMLEPNVPKAWVPLVHMLVFVLLVLLLPWGIVYAATMNKFSRNGPIAVVCGLREAIIGVIRPDNVGDYDYFPFINIPDSPPSVSPPPPTTNGEPVSVGSSKLPPQPPPSPPLPPFPPRAVRQQLCEHNFEDAFDYSLSYPSNLPKYPNNTVFVALVIQDVDVKRFVLSGLVRASFQTPPVQSRNADPNSDDSSNPKGIITTPPINRKLSLVININGNDVMRVSGSVSSSTASLDNLPVFAERHTRVYPFDTYRAHIRLTISLQDDEGGSTRVPFVAAVMQKGSEFKYHVRNPREKYLMGMDGRNDFSEASFLIWGNRSAISRFVSIFIILLMWSLSIIIFTQALYIVWYRKLDKVIEMASFTATVLFALPQLRSTQPGIPTEANLVIDMTGFIWNMAMVSIACIIYLYMFYSTLVEENGNDIKPTESSQMEEQPPKGQKPQTEEPQTAGQNLQTEEQPPMEYQQAKDMPPGQ